MVYDSRFSTLYKNQAAKVRNKYKQQHHVSFFLAKYYFEVRKADAFDFVEGFAVQVVTVNVLFL